MQRQEQRVPRDVRLSHEPVDHAAGAHEGRAQLKHEDRTAQPRSARSPRLSCSFFALAAAIAPWAMPSLKYNSSGTMVRPLRLVPPISLRISCAWSSSLRERAGGGLL